MIGIGSVRPNRDYDAVAEALRGLEGDLDARMRAAADALWETLRGAGVSWIGFYLAEGERMVLGPSRDSPACSPIGLHGMCGRALTSKQALVVRDVRELGEGYIACDPRDMSEVVVPLFAGSACWGVLDADSHDVGAFEPDDAVALAELMALAGLSTHGDDPMAIRTL